MTLNEIDAQLPEAEEIATDQCIMRISKIGERTEIDLDFRPFFESEAGREHRDRYGLLTSEMSKPRFVRVNRKAEACAEALPQR